MRADLRKAISWVGVLLAAGGAALAKEELSAAWAGTPPVIDGSASDWSDALSLLEKEGVSVGVRNDAHFLYLCVTTKRPETERTAFLRGLRLQIRPEGGKTFEVRFPLGVADNVEPAPLHNGGGGAHGPKGPPSYDDPDNPPMMQLLAPGMDEPLSMPAANALDVEPRVAVSGGAFVYEARVPLMQDASHPYAANATPGSRVRIELTTAPAPQRAGGGPEGMGEGEARGGREGGMEGGGMEGGRGMRGGGGGTYAGHGGGAWGGGSGRDSGYGSAPLKLKIDVRLATAPAAAPAAGS